MIQTAVFILFDPATKCGHFFSPLQQMKIGRSKDWQKLLPLKSKRKLG